MTDAHDDERLYAAIGYIIIKWSFIDVALDFIVSTIYTDCGGNSLRPRMPKFLKEKTGFVIEAVEKITQLHPFRRKAENIIGRITNIKDLREDFAHSVLTNPSHVDGVFRFVRLDAKDHNHGMKVWEFNVTTFPKMSENLEGLVRDTQALAKSLEKAFHKPLSQ